jgi:hypothetical protein
VVALQVRTEKEVPIKTLQDRIIAVHCVASARLTVRAFQSVQTPFRRLVRPGLRLVRTLRSTLWNGHRLSLPLTPEAAACGAPFLNIRIPAASQVAGWSTRTSSQTDHAGLHPLIDERSAFAGMAMLPICVMTLRATVSRSIEPRRSTR